MIKTWSILCFTFISAMANSQTGKATKSPAKPAVKKPVSNSKYVLKNANDSMSYAVGMSVASFYKEQGITSINTELVTKACNDAMTSQPTLLTEEQMNMSISNYLQQLKKEKSAVARKAGEEFLAANKSKPGVITLPSGLQYMVITVGTGPKPALTDTVRCHYHGTLINGTIFDSSVDKGQPIEYPVNGFTKGWMEALQLMPVGSKWRLFVPADLAYGDSQAGPHIAPGSTLLFDMELLAIVHN